MRSAWENLNMRPCCTDQVIELSQYDKAEVWDFLVKTNCSRLKSRYSLYGLLIDFCRFEILVRRHYGRIVPLTINLQSVCCIGYIHKSCTINESWIKKLWTIPFSFLVVVPVASLLSLQNALLKIHLFVNKKESLYKVYTNLHVKYYI